MAFSGPSARGLGGARAGAGRPKGVPNKTTSRTREAITRLVEENLENMALWLAEIHDREGPLASMRVMVDLLEYAIPKLARQEVVGAAAEDEPPTAADVRFEPLTPENRDGEWRQ